MTPGGLVVLTDRRLASGPLAEVVREAVRCGAGWVVLRERDLPYAVRRDLAAELRAVVPAGRLIVAGPDPLGGDAVHLAGTDPLPVDTAGAARGAGSSPGAGVARLLVGRSWHGAEELTGVDYVTVSPVYPTASKPGYGPALGPGGAAAMRAPVPWLALGGIDSPRRAVECALAGAAGIAVMGAVMRMPSLARELAAAFSANSPRTASAVPDSSQPPPSRPAMTGSGSGSGA